VALLDKIRSANNGDGIEVEFSDEFRDEIEQDPAPGKPAKSGRAAAAPKAPAKRVTATVRKQLADEIEAYLILGAGAWQMRDPYCGEVMEKQAQEIAVRMAAILGRNPRIVEWLHTTNTIGDWVKLGMAILPVLTAIREHHIRKTVGTDDDSPDPNDFPAYRPA
jgi:hypothetical protein